MPDVLTDPVPRPERSRFFFLRGLENASADADHALSGHLGLAVPLAERRRPPDLAAAERPVPNGPARRAQWGNVRRFWTNGQGDWQWWAQLVGVSLAVLSVYVVGLLVGNLIGRTFWRFGESLVLRIPIVRAIYPAAKQITDFVLIERSTDPADNRRVVACRPHDNGIWSIGLVTGNGLPTLERASGEELLTVFVPSSPTAFTRVRAGGAAVGGGGIAAESGGGVADSGQRRGTDRARRDRSRWRLGPGVILSRTRVQCALTKECSCTSSFPAGTWISPRP